jgi:hypothetical protein
VIALPDVVTHAIDDKTEFMVLASDGIWDVMSNQAVVDFIRSRIEAGLGLRDICEQMLSSCLEVGVCMCVCVCVCVVCVDVSYYSLVAFHSLSLHRPAQWTT